MYHQNLVHSVAYRTISQVVGYAMFLLDSRKPSDTEKLEIPHINVGVRLLPSVKTVYPEIKAEHVTWPAFHQGVAVGLSIQSESEVVDSSWIFFNRPDQPTPAFGGLLLGLGLRGKLRDLATWHIFPSLAPRNDHVSIGLLLGMSASYAGSQDKRLTTMLSAGVGALLPLGSSELNTSPLMQSASIFGLGLVHVGSGSHHFAETTLNEIGRHDISGLEEQTEYKELYSFSAACAFGLIMLGRYGRNREYDNHCLQRLRTYFVPTNQPDQESEESSANETFDVNVTAPGAVLAVGLMCLRTGRADVSALLAAPQNAFELDHVRPDMLVVRTLSYSLIHWDGITPTKQWLESQFPTFILDAWRNKASTGTIDEIIELAYFHILSGAGFALGLKKAGTGDREAQSLLFNTLELFVHNMSQNSGSS